MGCLNRLFCIMATTTPPTMLDATVQPLWRHIAKKPRKQVASTGLENGKPHSSLQQTSLAKTA